MGAVCRTNAEALNLPGFEAAQAYNALDAALTLGIWKVLESRISGPATLVYDFERAMQGPAFTMACRGIAVDESVARIEIGRLKNAENRLGKALNACAAEWGMPACNPLSPAQVRALLFNATGESVYASGTTSEDALRMLQARVGGPIAAMVAIVLRIRELRKLRGFLAAKRSPDGRLRSSFNVGATTSGRWSFSKNVFGEGLNFGNVPKSARAMFVPSGSDWTMVNCDLRQAESLVVAHLCSDEAYIRAHEGGDAHSAVAQDLWPGAEPREPNFLQGMSRRDLAKRIGHGTNYGIGERKSSRITGLPIAEIIRFRRAFFGAYPGIKRRIDEMPKMLASNGGNVRISAINRPHQYLGHPNDPETARAALADEPQGIVADVLNVALWRLWRRHDVGDSAPRIRCLSQAYDSVLFECRNEDLDAAREAVAAAFAVSLTINERTFVIPHDFGHGRNWKEACS